MAEPTSPFTQETTDFIARNAVEAEAVAKELGLSANALMGAVANEHDTRFNQDLIFDSRGGTLQWAADALVAQFADNEDIIDNYNNLKRGIANPGGKLNNFAMIDVGPGNIRIETAIDVLNDYLVAHPDDGDDPLSLKQYRGDYYKLAMALEDFVTTDATFAIAGLVIAKADHFFSSKDQAAWGRLTADEQDASRVMFYKIGPDRLSQNIDRRIIDARQNGIQFDFNPHGDGGQQHLNNVNAINNAMKSGGVGSSGNPSAPTRSPNTDSYDVNESRLDNGGIRFTVVRTNSTSGTIRTATLEAAVDGRIRSQQLYALDSGKLLSSEFYDENGNTTAFSDLRNLLWNPTPLKDQSPPLVSTPFSELSESTRKTLLDPNGLGLPTAGTGLQPINININPDPKPQSGFLKEGQLRQDVSNGFVVNRPTYQVSFPGKELDDISFASTQMGSIATGGVRPGEVQRDLNPRPNSYLADNLIDAARLIPGVGGILGPLAGAINAVVTNGLSASMTKNVFIDPLVLDLSGTGVKLTPIGAGVLFDIDNSGTQKRTGWTGDGTGLLVVDAGDGKITNASQLISEYYGGQQGSKGAAGQRRFKDGFAALASEDKNSDLILDQTDPIWAKLKVWVDANHNGVSDSGELKSLDELGITQFNLTVSQAFSGELRDGNEILAKGTFSINGKMQEALAVNFIADPVGNTLKELSGGTEITSTAGDVVKKSYVSNVTAGEVLDAAKLNVDNLYGGLGNDTLTAAPTGSWLVGGGGSNIYNGSAADDVFVISASDDVRNIHGNGGRDTAIVIGAEAVSLNMADAGLTIAQGGRGDDVIRSGGQAGVFIKGGSGNQTLIGGGGNDVLSGGSGNNVIIGGTGKAVIYAGPNGDVIYASDGGSVINAGGGGDFIYGRAGNDVIIVGRGNATIDGGSGTNIVEFHGSYGDYSIVKNGDTYVATDKVSDRDGTVTFRNVQKLNFSDISGVDLTASNALPVRDSLRVDKDGKNFDRLQPHLIAAAQLLANDQKLNSSGPLRIKSVSDAVGGTVSLTAAGDVLFTPDKSFTGIMSFKYDVIDASGKPSIDVIDLASGNTAPMRAAATLLTPEIPVDPLVSRQWYLSDINIFPVWQDYSGKGVRIGQFEPGGQFAVGPEVFNTEHPDLKANVDKTWLQTETSNKSLPEHQSDHATMVAGVMVAAKNGIGSVGIAYDATVAGHYLANDGRDFSALARMVNYDVANNSWNFTNDFALSNVQGGVINTATALSINMQFAAQNGRGGLGTVIVAAGGNNREKGGSAQGSLTNNSRFAVQVGAINAQSDLSTLEIASKPFSNPGASLLVSAPGSNVTSTGQLIETEQGSIFGSSYNTLNGTSFATPIVSGVIADMLQANPKLGYRDVQAILALSARKVDDPSTQWQWNAAKNWNAGGMHTSHDYGFGNIDALAAVRMAESWMTQSNAANEFVVSGKSQSGPLSLSAGQTVSSTIDIQAGIRVEHVEVDIDANIGRLGDLTIRLVSPDGTASVLLDRAGKAAAGTAGFSSDDTGSQISGAFKYSFMSTHDWGEVSQGKWKLEVTDAATGLPVTLNNWNLRIFGAKGSADDTYYFTNEYKELAASNPARRTLNDAVNGTAGGRNTINTAAVSGDTIINLATGVATLNGTDLTLGTSGAIQNAISGDGDDSLTAGNAKAILDGQRGNNTLTGGAGVDFFVVHRRDGGLDTIVKFDAQAGEKIDLVGFRGLEFGKLNLAQQGSDVKVDLGAGQSVLIRNIQVAALTASNFVFQDTFVAPVDYVQEGATAAPIEGPGLIILNGGATGIKINGTIELGQTASLTGTIYRRDTTASNTFVIDQQPVLVNYNNALAGFKHGVDKIDLTKLGITRFDDLIIENVNRVVIGGVPLIRGVSLKSKSLGAQGVPVELVYLDGIDPSQLTMADLILTIPTPEKASIVTKPLTMADVPVRMSDPIKVQIPEITIDRPKLVFNQIKIELPSVKTDAPKVTIAPIRMDGGPVVLDPGLIIADTSVKSVRNTDGTTTQISIGADGTKTEISGRFGQFDIQKKNIRTVITKPDGTITELIYNQDAANELASSTTTLPDATKIVTTFNSSGNKKTEITTMVDGTRIETTYGGATNDDIWSQITTKPDGTKSGVSFGPLGRTESRTDKDGTLTEVTYVNKTDTVSTKKITTPDQTTTQVWFNTSTGLPASQSITRADGSSVSTIWGKDQITIWSTASDKTVTKTVVDIATSYLRFESITNVDKSKVESTFDANGVLVSKVAIAADGTKTPLPLTSPVLLDLNGDGHIDLRPLDTDALATGSSVTFDWNGDGARDGTAWVGPQDGFLAIDLGEDGQAGPDGKIDQSKELAFSEWATPDQVAANGGSVSDLDGLRLVFDSNHDNVLDASDDRWSEFRVWRDGNQNGSVDDGELQTMSEAGIKLINLLHTPEGSQSFPDGSAISGTSSYQTTDGTSHYLVGDATLSYQPAIPKQNAA
jgi:subtilisin-like proprotein convertase family protein